MHIPYATSLLHSTQTGMNYTTVYMFHSILFFTFLSLDAATRAFCYYTPSAKVYGPGQFIPFTKVAYQIGGGFVSSGYYRCPQSGVYSFTYCLYSGFMRFPTPPRSSAEMRIGGVPRGDALSYNSDTKYIIVNTCKTIIYYCRYRQSVYLRSKYTANSIGQWDKRTSFCGFCINC